jgi:hypothetical protein
MGWRLVTFITFRQPSKAAAPMSGDTGQTSGFTRMSQLCDGWLRVS